MVEEVVAGGCDWSVRKRVICEESAVRIRARVLRPQMHENARLGTNSRLKHMFNGVDGLLTIAEYAVEIFVYERSEDPRGCHVLPPTDRVKIKVSSACSLIENLFESIVPRKTCA